MKKLHVSFYISLFFIGIFLLQSCKTYDFRSNYQDSNKLMHDQEYLLVKPFLKAHLKNGGICIFRDTWKIDTVKNVVFGEGDWYDFNRKNSTSGDLSVSIDSVAIFETNNKLFTERGRTAALSILTGVDVIVGIICITNPKACFGSCPTFYLNENDNVRSADAEGFTSAITPSMEYADVDALKNKTVTGNLFSITMKNEALETHCVNDVKLLAYPRKKGERVYQTATNDFYLCENNYPVSKASGNEGDITSLLQKEDRQERFSLSDKNNLSSKEEIFIDFDAVKSQNDLGLIVDFRQTLMTTYLFYAAMGYMGNNVGDVFSKLETDKRIREKFDGTTKLLGNIDVYAWNGRNKRWDLQDRLFEKGPVAINSQIIPLKNSGAGSKVKLKLVMNKGLWRIDYLALTNLKEKVKPIEISPSDIRNKGKVDTAALSAIMDPGKYLISMPGSEYKFNFMLPSQNDDYELFLYTKGYYLEWMREHWIKDKDFAKLRQMVLRPGKYLRLEAKAYKPYETEMEQIFWNSKVDTKTFSYHEN